MLASLSLVFLVGLSAAAIVRRLHLPGLVGMIATGIVLGPYVLDLLDPSLLGISAELRQIALIIILIKAGLSLDLGDLKKVGRPAVLMSFVPACCEIAGYVLLAPPLLGVTRAEAAVMGAVLAAVSPAVVVPRMVRLMEEGRGTDKRIPQLITAGASCDDVFVIVLFTTFTGMAQGGDVSWRALADVPVSILLGVALGALCGAALAWIFEAAHAHGHTVRGSLKALIVLALACGLSAVETALKGTLAVSGLLAVMSMACVLRARCVPAVTAGLAVKCGKLWLAAEVLLFVLVGAAVDIRYTLAAGGAAVALIAAALLFRAAGVLLCLLRTPLVARERLFCVLAYMPKATVQAAIGAVPLAMGLPCGSIVLSVAVLGILLTAPLGAFAIDLTAPRLLRQTLS